MQFEGEFVVETSPEEAWPYFTDTDILQDCAPGCKEIVLQSPSRARAKLEVGVGSVKPAFDVEAVVTEYDQPSRLEVEARGEASRNSFAVTAWQELGDNGNGTTTVHWGATAEVSGVIASLGRRAIESVTNKLVTEFFEDVQGHIEAGTPAEANLTAAEDADEEFEAPTVEGGVLAELLALVTGGDEQTDTGGRNHSIRSLSIGAIAGAVVILLWNRLRGGRGGIGYFLVGVAAGVIGKVLWDEYARGSPDMPEPEVPPAEADDEPTADEPEGATRSAPEASRADTDGEGMIDDPLDRLN